MNLNRNRKNTTSYRTQNNKEWLRVNADEWQSVTPKGNLTLIGKRTDPAVFAGVKKKREPVTIFGILKSLVSFITDLAAKFVAWLTVWN